MPVSYPPVFSPKPCRISGMSSGGARSAPARSAKRTRVVAKGPPLSPHSISSAMSAKKNSRPVRGSAGAPAAPSRGVGGSRDRSICARKCSGVPLWPCRGHSMSGGRLGSPPSLVRPAVASAWRRSQMAASRCLPSSSGCPSGDGGGVARGAVRPGRKSPISNCFQVVPWRMSKLHSTAIVECAKGGRQGGWHAAGRPPSHLGQRLPGRCGEMRA